MAAPEELDLDPVEPEEPGGKGKGTKFGMPKARDDRGDELQPRRSVADGRKMPYPPAPVDVPEGLTDYPESFRRQQQLLLAGLIVFLTFYVGALLFCALIGVWCAWSFWHWTPLKVAGLLLSALTFLFLVKGFFKRHPIDWSTCVEINEHEHPVLFEFIHRLCEEVNAPEPNKVFASAGVNAMCVMHTSLFSLFVEPRRDLLVGLGLVNAVNLSEFKAILAHEFGHFSHLGNTSNYVHIVQRVIADMIRGEDRLDRLVARCKRRGALKWLGYAIGGPLGLGRAVLIKVFELIALQNWAVAREQEFHADLVAARAAGSNPATHGLLRVRFAARCFGQALRDLATAADHKLYSSDLYLHQDRAAAVVRRKHKEPQMGLPPVIAHPTDGRNVRVFDAERDEFEDRDEPPPMWRSHPGDADREENVKERFVAAPIDHRSPWILFDDAAGLKERLTYKFYRAAFDTPEDADLADAIEVQKFIDNEHADATYDPKYKGAYDDRLLEPGDPVELNAIARAAPWDEDRLEKVYDGLYDGCEEHAEEYAGLHKEMCSLRSGIVGRPSPNMKRKLDEVEKKQDENWEWFKSFDRRVYLLHVQMAQRVDEEVRDELVERYRFQLEVQRLYQESRSAFFNADMYLAAHFAQERGALRLPPDFDDELTRVLRESWTGLKNIVRDARGINLPAMKNFEEGKNLAAFILEGETVPEPPPSFAKLLAWAEEMMTQLNRVRKRCFRLHFKSVGGILRTHERIVAKWKQRREPTAAEVFDAGPVAIDAVPVEAIPAEIVPARVVEEEVITVDVLPEEEPIPAEVFPAEVSPPRPPKTFVAPAATPRPEFRSTVPLVPPPAPAPELVASAESDVIDAEVIDAEVIDVEVVDAEVIDAEVIDTEIIPAEIVEPDEPTDAGATFSLDPDARAPQPLKSASKFGSKPAAPVAADDVFSLDADGTRTPTPARPVAAPEPTKPAYPTTPFAPPAAAPTTRSGFGSSALPAPITKPGNGKRPAIKITMVKPGGRSPLAK